MMGTQRHELEAWLGDDHGLSGEQLDELTDVADALRTQYPEDDDRDEREAALVAAYRVLLDGSAVVDELASALQRARGNEVKALAGLRQAARMLIGKSETQAGFARRAGVDRMAVRDWLGLRT